MVITDEAKLLIKEELDANDLDCLRVTLQQGCCGTEIDIELSLLTAEDQPISINDIFVVMDNQTQERAEKVTLLVEDDEVVIEDAESCCC